ncbi:MAG: Transport-associated protein [Candidatus Gallionella acididurans]|uniref:Transport-associated protein n=1 Tax=Candidatus Gallionella acididurans TaxID=1796491 RepID=A0A139BQC6_9PROT|nr:MAG: Transport-associated protein [Candidatus Gallionella acididurans]
MKLVLNEINEPWKGNKMKLHRNFKLTGLLMLLVVGLVACEKPGPAETAGKKIDQTADRVGDKLSEQSTKAGVAIDDTEITSKVKAAIFAEPGLKTLQISVDTVKGLVTLSGSVDSLTNSHRAKELASAVQGVNEVENRLVVKSAN